MVSSITAVCYAVYIVYRDFPPVYNIIMSSSSINTSWTGSSWTAASRTSTWWPCGPRTRTPNNMTTHYPRHSSTSTTGSNALWRCAGETRTTTTRRTTTCSRTPVPGRSAASWTRTSRRADWPRTSRAARHPATTAVPSCTTTLPRIWSPSPASRSPPGHLISARCPYPARWTRAAIRSPTTTTRSASGR